jgi:hypothetical protein
LLALASTVSLGFGPDYHTYVLKWDLLFNERKGLTATGVDRIDYDK